MTKDPFKPKTPSKYKEIQVESNNIEATPEGVKASKLSRLLKEGKPVVEAQKEAGITLKKISDSANLSFYFQNLLEQYHVDDKLLQALAKSRLTAAMESEDEKVAVDAAKHLDKMARENQGPRNQQNIFVAPSEEVRDFIKKTSEYMGEVVDVKGEEVD